jgi:hypothetical protein
MNRTWGHSALILSSLTLALGIAAPGIAGAGADLAAEDNAPVVATGRVTKDGKAVGEADIVAMALPNQASAIAAKEGDIAETRIIARARTGSDGRFQIRLDPSELGPNQVGDDGQVDIELVAADAEREISWHFTATRPNGGAGDPTRSGVESRRSWSTSAADLERRSRPAEIAIDFGANPTVSEETDPPTQWVQADGQPAASSAASVVTVPRSTSFSTVAAPSCYPQWKKWHYGRDEAFVNLYAWSGAMGTVSQVNGVDHTLGVGYGVSGGKGSWSQSGTRTISLSAGAERGGIADATVYNRINYRDLGWTNLPECRNMAIRRLPISVHSLLTKYTYARHVNFGNCTHGYTGGTYWKSKGKNITFGAGANIGPINVSAQSGYNGESKIAWTVTRRTSICGSTPEGWAKAPQASASAG